MLRSIWFSLALSLLTLTGCTTLPSYNPAFTTPPIQADPYGNDPSLGGMGQLQVFTATTQQSTGDGFVKAIPQNYRVKGSDGRWRSIVNSVYGDPSPIPKKVELAPGSYTVEGLADIYRTATVPVIITPGDTTVVNLQKQPYPAAPPPPAKAVTAPDGYVVGWRAD